MPLPVQSQGENEQRDVCRNTDRREDNNHITTRSESLSVQSIFADLVEELPVALHTPESTETKYPCTVDSKQGSNGVEFARKDFEYDKGK